MTPQVSRFPLICGNTSDMAVQTVGVSTANAANPPDGYMLAADMVGCSRCKEDRQVTDLIGTRGIQRRRLGRAVLVLGGTSPPRLCSSVSIRPGTIALTWMLEGAGEIEGDVGVPLFRGDRFETPEG